MSETSIPGTSAARRPPPPRTRTRWFRARHEVAWLFLLALAVRAAAAYANPAIERDGVSFLQSAARIGRGGWAAWSAGPDHPLAPWLVSLAPPGLDPEIVATALCVFAGAFAVWPLHVLARRACGRHAATAACIVYAALPKAIGVASTPLTTAVLLPLFLGAFALVVAAYSPPPPRPRIVRLAREMRRRRAFRAWRRRRWRSRRKVARLVFAGLACGLAYLCRPEGLLAAVGAVTTALLLARSGRRLASAALVATAFLLVAAPYAAELSRNAGHVTLSPKKDVESFVGVKDVKNPPARAADARESVRRVGSTLDGALTTPVGLLVLVGLFSPTRWRRRRSARPRIMLVLFALAQIALVVVLWTRYGYANSRHMLPGALLLVPFAGEGFVVIGAFISRAVARRRLAVVLASFLAIVLVVRSLLRPEGEAGEPARRLGEAIVDASPTKHVVVATFGEPLVAYYAGRSLAADGGDARDVPLWGRFKILLSRSDAAGERADLVAALRSEGAQWFVVDLFSSKTNAAGETETPSLLAKRLVDDGVLGAPVTSSGSPLTAFPVR